MFFLEFEDDASTSLDDFLVGVGVGVDGVVVVDVFLVFFFKRVN